MMAQEEILGDEASLDGECRSGCARVEKERRPNDSTQAKIGLE
jgi:hypothetical protein